MAICTKEIEMKIFKTYSKNFLHLSLSLVLTSNVGIAFSAQANESEVSVPKGIQDIVNSLKQANADNKSRDDDQRLLAKDISKDGKAEDLYSHYYFQAMAAHRLGRINQRIDFLTKSLQFAKKGTHQEFQVTNELFQSEMQVGDSKRAIFRLEALLDKVPDRNTGVLIGYNGNLAEAYSTIGDFEKAENHLRVTGSLLTYVRRAPAYSLFGASWNKAFFSAQAEISFQKGQFSEAEISFRKAIDIFTPQINNLEANIISSGDTERAPGLGSNERTSPNMNVPKESLENLFIRLSATLIKLRKINEAEFYSREALKMSLARTGKASVSTSKALRQLAIVMLSRERNKDAIYLLNQSLLGIKESGVTEESIQLAVTKKTLATALIAENKFIEALKIYSDLEITLKAFPETARFVDIDSPELVFALIKTSDLAPAERVAKRLVEINEIRTGKSSKESTQAKLLLAFTFAEQRKDELAQGLFSTSINNLIELERESAADSDGISMQEKKFLAGYVESYLGVLYRAFDKSSNQKLINEAFVLGDLARSSNVQRALSASTARANITDQRLSKLIREEQDLNQQIAFLTKFSKELAMQPANEQSPQIQAKMRADIEQLRKDAKRATMLIGLDFPAYAELINPKPITLEKIQKTIKPNETLVTWFVGTKTSYVWAVNQQGDPLFKAIPIGQKEVRQNVNELRKALDAKVAYIDEIPAFDFQLSSRIYDELFKPVQSAFAGKDTLVVVPHDDIGQLPLGVLTTAPFQLKGNPKNLFANYKEAPFLIRQYAIVSSPSVTALNALRGLPEPKKDRLDFIGFGDPLFSTQQAQAEEKQLAIAVTNGTQLASRGLPLQLRNTPQTADVSSAQVSRLPRLPDTSDEILEISKLFNVKPDRDIFLQKRANLDQVLKVDMSNRKVVMFSTHGLMPGELDGLSQPALALTNPEVQNLKGDGLLKVDTILTMKLDADWVVLSACNTAAGEGEGAEALSGLGRAFFFAGARAILVSSWPVDSEASRKLMTDMFKHYVQDKGMSKPRALQLASIRILDEGVPDDKEANYSYAHPLFWGPFTMVGN
jgi:CHAT domain-containing protein